MARARAVVLPSAWEETFGLVAVEAMASGVAPIAAGHGSFTELITPGLTASCSAGRSGRARLGDRRCRGASGTV